MDAHGNFVEAKHDVMDAVSARENLFDSLEGLSTRKGRSWLSKGPSRKKSTLKSGSMNSATLSSVDGGSSGSDLWDRGRVKDHLRQFLTGESFDSHALLQVLQREFGKGNVNLGGQDYYSLGARGRSGVVLKPFVGEDGHHAAEIELLTPSESVFLLRKIAQFIDTSATSSSSSTENTKSMLEIREMRKKLKKGEKLTDTLQGLSAEFPMFDFIGTEKDKELKARRSTRDNPRWEAGEVNAEDLDVLARALEAAPGAAGSDEEPPGDDAEEAAVLLEAADAGLGQEGERDDAEVDPQEPAGLERQHEEHVPVQRARTPALGVECAELAVDQHDAK